jgi:hypothetical protein
MSKRWRTTTWPTASTRSHDSKLAAYRYVKQLSEERTLGMSRITLVVVKVSEDKGPWQTYERLSLPIEGTKMPA